MDVIYIVKKKCPIVQQFQVPFILFSTLWINWAWCKNLTVCTKLCSTLDQRSGNLGGLRLHSIFAISCTVLFWKDISMLVFTNLFHLYTICHLCWQHLKRSVGLGQPPLAVFCLQITVRSLAHVHLMQLYSVPSVTFHESIQVVYESTERLWIRLCIQSETNGQEKTGERKLETDDLQTPVYHLLPARVH